MTISPGTTNVVGAGSIVEACLTVAANSRTPRLLSMTTMRGSAPRPERAYDATPGGTPRGRNAVDLLVDVKREFVAALDRTPLPLTWDAGRL